MGNGSTGDRPPTQRRLHDLLIQFVMALATSAAAIVGFLGWWDNQESGRLQREQTTAAKVLASAAKVSAAAEQSQAGAQEREVQASNLIAQIQGASRDALQRQAQASDQLVSSAKTQLSITETQAESLKGQLDAQRQSLLLNYHPIISAYDTWITDLFPDADDQDKLFARISIHFVNDNEVPATDVQTVLFDVDDGKIHHSQLQLTDRCKSLSYNDLPLHESEEFSNVKRYIPDVPLTKGNPVSMKFVADLIRRDIGSQFDFFHYYGILCIVYKSEVDKKVHHQPIYFGMTIDLNDVNIYGEKLRKAKSAVPVNRSMFAGVKAEDVALYPLPGD